MIFKGRFARFVLLVCIAFFGFNTSNVFAADNAGITLVPAMIEESADPGATLTKTLKITNDSTQDKEYYIYKKNIKGVEAGGVPLFAQDETEKTGYEMTEWIIIPTEPIKVAAGATVDLPVTINVPSSATPGSHFGGVFVSAEPPKLREIGAGVGYEVASIMSIRISGDIIDTARIRSLATDKLLYSKKDVHFTAKIENQGNILIRPRGPVTITSMFGKSETLTVNDSQAGVFPGTVRGIEFDWKDDSLGFGRYEAVLALSYDGVNGQQTIVSTTTFWVFPIKIMVSILVGLIALAGLGYGLTRYYINQAIVRSAGSRKINSQRYRKQVGISRFTFVSITIMMILVFFLLVLLIISI